MAGFFIDVTCDCGIHINLFTSIATSPTEHTSDCRIWGFMRRTYHQSVCSNYEQFTFFYLADVLLIFDKPLEQMGVKGLAQC